MRRSAGKMPTLPETRPSPGQSLVILKPAMESRKNAQGAQKDWIAENGEFTRWVSE